MITVTGEDCKLSMDVFGIAPGGSREQVIAAYRERIEARVRAECAEQARQDADCQRVDRANKAERIRDLEAKLALMEDAGHQYALVAGKVDGLESQVESLTEQLADLEAQFTSAHQALAAWRDWANNVCLVAHTRLSDSDLRAAISETEEKLRAAAKPALTVSDRARCEVIYDDMRARMDALFEELHAVKARAEAAELERGQARALILAIESAIPGNTYTSAHNALDAVLHLVDERDALVDASGFACECPPPGCDCPGCSLARDASATLKGTP